MPSQPHTGVRDLAEATRHLAWVADALFVLEGRWSARMDSPAAVEHLARHSRHHGWHATLWQDLAPDSPALAALTAPQPPTGWAQAIELAGDRGDDAADGVRLALLYRALVPRALALVHELDARLTGPGAPAARRVVTLVRRDLHDELEAGTVLLVHALGDDGLIERAAEAVKALDQALVNL